MRKAAGRIAPFLFVIAAAAVLCARNGDTGDYEIDAGPTIDALAGGRIGDGLAMHPLMGPFSIFLRIPFAALGGSELSAYNLGAFVCLLAPGLLGIYLSRIAAARGAGTLFQWCLIVVCIVNPVTVNAIELGHPEELLGGALLIASAVSAVQGASMRAAVLLGLALATKQWAILGLVPILMALPARRLRAGAVAIGVVVLLTVPSLLANPEGFISSQTEASGTHGIVTPWSVWYAASSEHEVQVDVGGEMTPVTRRLTSDFVSAITHPLIVGLGLLLPLALALRRRRVPLTGRELMAVLALLLLFRCALDPVNNLYYHAPLLLALAGIDALFGRMRLPVATLTGVALLTAFQANLGEVGWVEFSLAYSLAAVAGAAALTATLLVDRRPGKSARTSDPAPASPAFS